VVIRRGQARELNPMLVTVMFRDQTIVGNLSATNDPLGSQPKVLPQIISCRTRPKTVAES
jgi:hypothetical protein